MESPSTQSTGMPVVATPARKKGRPRKHVSNAAKQQRYRARIARKHGKALNAHIDYGKPEPAPPTQEPPVPPERSREQDSSEENNHRWETYDARMEKFTGLWNEYLNAVGLSMARGSAVTDAPHGKGRVVSGGFDVTKIQEIDAAEQVSQGKDGYISRPSE
jgi:hypothetical protein